MPEKVKDLLLLNGTLVDCPGLIHGKTGIAIFFFHYARYAGNELYEDYAMALIKEIQAQIHANSSADYERGISGIGAGIDYLVQNNFLEADSDLFEDFDKRMYRAVMYDPWIDLSIYDGLSGYGRYWICRSKEQKLTSGEALTYILNSIEEKISEATLKEKQDVFCFLHELSTISEYERKAKKIIEKLTAENAGFISNGLERFNESFLKEPLNAMLNHTYFKSPVLDLTPVLQEIEKPEKYNDMGIYNGYAGYGLCRLALLETQYPHWMQLM